VKGLVPIGLGVAFLQDYALVYKCTNAWSFKNLTYPKTLVIKGIGPKREIFLRILVFPSCSQNVPTRFPMMLPGVIFKFSCVPPSHSQNSTTLEPHILCPKSHLKTCIARSKGKPPMIFYFGNVHNVCVFLVMGKNQRGK
jgi:hypothetical protein